MSRIYYLKRCLSLLLACGMLCGLMAFPPAQAAGRNPESGEWFYSQLSAANKEAYDAIQTHVDKLVENSTDPSAVSFTPTQGEPDGAAIFAFFRDHPEYFWIDASKLVWSESDDGRWSLSTKVTGESFFCEGFDVDTLSNVRSQFNNQVQAIIRGMPTGGDTVAQLRYLNNWIAQNNVYNPLGVGASNYSRCAASGILSNNSEDTAPVCYGYATAFKVLLDEADIPNAYIEGWAYNQNNWPNGEQHAWNYVKVNETWYAIDPTWDDPKLVSGSARFHYFLVGSETVTETSSTMSGKGMFGQNHDASQSPAAKYGLTYPTLSPTASMEVVTSGFELIQGGSSTKYDTLEAALNAAQNGGTVKLWEPATITQMLTIPDGVTLDLNGQNSNSSVSSMAIAVSGSVAGPLFTINSGSDVSIVNSGNFTSLENKAASTCIQNDGTLTLGNNLALTPGVVGNTISGNTPELAPQSYQYTSSSKVYNVYLVAQPESPKSGSYSAQKGDTVQQLLDAVSGNMPSLSLCYYTFSGATSPMVTPDISWQLSRSPNDGNHTASADRLENGDYIFIAQVYDYAVPYTVTVSGVPDAPKYSVTVNGGNGASGSGTYGEGAQVTVSAGTKEGYTFQCWMAEGVTLDDDTQSTVSFTMPPNDVTLIAQFTQGNTVSITDATLVPKTYDGTTAATVERVTFSGGTPVKDIDYTATAAFDTADAGIGKTAIVTVTLLNGNYTFNGGKTTDTYTLNNQTIGKATPTGAPRYTPITTSGKTLADAGLTAEGSTFSVPGTVIWEQPVTTEVQANTKYTWVFTPADQGNYNSFSGSVELWRRPDNGGSSSGSSGSSPSTGNQTETTTNPDGSTTTTVTNNTTGTVTETTKNPDGSTEVVETQKDGTVTTTTTDAAGNRIEVAQNPDGSGKTTVENKDGSNSVTVVDGDGKADSEVSLSQSAVQAAQGTGAPVALPMPALSVTTDRESAPTVNVNLPTSGTVKVEIPVKNVTPGTVAVLVKADGTEEVVKTSLTTENGVAVTLSNGDTVKIVDNSKAFADVPGSYWGSDGIAFASSRELMSGTGESTFAPETAMTRAMIVTVLARLDGVDTSNGGTWYEAGRQWAMENGISDGTDLEQSLTREQLAAMLYRYAGEPAVSGDLGAFVDGDSVSSWAQPAMAWAVEHGILTGTSVSTLSPQDTATRAQIATILMRYSDQFIIR